MNRIVGVLTVLLVIALAFAVSFGYTFETKTPITTTYSIYSTETLTLVKQVSVNNNRTITVTTTNSAVMITITEEIIGVVTPQIAFLRVMVSPVSPNCTILIPLFQTRIIGYNSTEYILPNGDLNSTFSIISTVTTFSQMPSAQTAYTTITASSNIEVNTTITSGNSTITTSTCPVYA